MITLRGLTWDHPRATDSIRAASEAFSKARPDVGVEWTVRSLHEFESRPLEELAESFDVLSIDHPFVGDAAAQGSLAPLGSLIPEETLAARSSQYIGPSFASYLWAGELWALPVDAACMVSAHRRDPSLGAIPATWDEVVPFVRDLGRDRAVIAANPTHLYGTLLSICQALAGPGPVPSSIGGPEWWGRDGIEDAIVEPALDLLREVVATCADRSLAASPVDVLEELAGGGEAVYTPLVFGYSTYALDRPGFARVSFRDAPTLGGGPTGTLTGGVGLAVSGRSAHPHEAADLVLHATSDSVQGGVYAAAGGQPASAAAWCDEAVNRRSAGFFEGTFATMSVSFLRPRRSGYPRYQREAAAALHKMFLDGATSRAMGETLSGLWSGIEHL